MDDYVKGILKGQEGSGCIGECVLVVHSASHAGDLSLEKAAVLTEAGNGRSA
jgi:hypothetical protein